MLPVKKNDELYILTAFMGESPNLSEIRVGLRKRMSLVFLLTNLHMQYTI